MTISDIAINISWTVTLIAVLLFIISFIVEEWITGPVMKYRGKYDILFTTTGAFILLTPVVWVITGIVAIWS